MEARDKLDELERMALEALNDIWFGINNIFILF